VASSAGCLLHVFYYYHQMFSDEVAASRAKLVEDARTFIVGTLKYEIRRLNSGSDICQIAFDLRVGTRLTISGLGAPSRLAKHHGCPFIIDRLKDPIWLDAHLAPNALS